MCVVHHVLQLLPNSYPPRYLWLAWLVWRIYNCEEIGDLFGPTWQLITTSILISLWSPLGLAMSNCMDGSSGRTHRVSTHSTDLWRCGGHKLIWGRTNHSSGMLAAVVRRILPIILFVQPHVVRLDIRSSGDQWNLCSRSLCKCRWETFLSCVA